MANLSKNAVGLFDSHCHIHDRRLDGIRDAVIERAISAGVSGCMTCGTSPADWESVASMQSRPGFEIEKAFGVHPWFIDKLGDDWQDILRGYLLKFPQAWVGEIGLDAAKEPGITEKARRILESQLIIAKELRRPVMLHGVKCLDELLSAIRPFAGVIPGFAIHCFSGSEVQLRRWLDLGAKISIGGAVLKSARLRRLAALIPPGQLLIETDSPDMLPPGAEPAVPGTNLNQPSNLVLVKAAIENR